jgi:hypothetical protein
MDLILLSCIKTNVSLFPFTEDADFWENIVVLLDVFTEEEVTVILWQMGLIVNRPKLLWHKIGKVKGEKEDERGG